LFSVFQVFESERNAVAAITAQRGHSRELVAQAG